MASVPHIQDELAANPERVVVDTKYGSLTGGRAKNGTATFLGENRSYDGAQLMYRT